MPPWSVRNVTSSTQIDKDHKEEERMKVLEDYGRVLNPLSLVVATCSCVIIISIFYFAPLLSTEESESKQLVDNNHDVLVEPKETTTAISLFFDFATSMNTSIPIIVFTSTMSSTILLLLLFVLVFSIILWYFGPYIFDETKSPSNHNQHRDYHHHLYTKINGIWYDFATFHHPGGPIALNLVKDRDATALFYSHHLISNMDQMEKILLKYRLDGQDDNDGNDDGNDQKLQGGGGAGEKNESSLLLLRKLDRTLGPHDDGGHYVWDRKSFHEDEFVKDLKTLLRSYLTSIIINEERNKNETRTRGMVGGSSKNSNIVVCDSKSLYRAAKATPSRWALIGTISITFIVTLPYYINGHIWTLLITPLLAWILIANYTHDAMHFSLHPNWRINAIVPYILPILSSPLLWRVEHTVGHHCYTNVAHKDPDIAHAPQLKREHVSIKWKKNHEHQGTLVRFVFLWSISVGIGLNIIGDIKTIMKGSLNNAVSFPTLSWSRLVVHILGRIFYIYIMFLWPFCRFGTTCLWKAILWSIVPMTIFGYAFMLNSQVNHLTIQCAHASDSNFLKHQVMTAQNFGCGCVWHFILSGGLNYQIEHHLFPFVNHCHLPMLAPDVKRICQRHGVRYNEVGGYVEALRCHLEHTHEMSKKQG